MTTQNFETGRSMVEMLGTLAIIGVLSIGGIAGYSYGMNKYHANAIVNDVNLRAVDLLSQLSQGHTPNLDSWETTSAGQYPISLNSDNAPTNYYIKVEQVPFEVCNMIADMMPENVEILVDNDTQECGEGDNILDFEYEGFEELQDEEEPNEKQCGTTICGTCQKCDVSTMTCLTVGDYEDKCTIDEGKSGWCVSGTCKPETCNCDLNQYCADIDESCTEARPSNTCINLETEFTEHTITYTDENGISKTEKWYVSNTPMSWWNAKNACKALNKNMPKNPSEFVLDWTEEGFGFYTRNKRLEALSAKIGNKWLWTDRLTTDICYGFSVYTFGNVANDTNRDDTTYNLAICH